MSNSNEAILTALKANLTVACFMQAQHHELYIFTHRTNTISNYVAAYNYLIKLVINLVTYYN